MLRNAFVVVVSALSLSVVGCAGGEAAAPESSGDALSLGSPLENLFGMYAAENQSQSDDFGSLVLSADGTYTAQVLTSVALRTPAVVCNRAPCNATETGTWDALPTMFRLHPEHGSTRIYHYAQSQGGAELTLGLSTKQVLRRVDPTTDSPAPPP
jgi:hypothetical protein